MLVRTLSPLKVTCCYQSRYMRSDNSHSLYNQPNGSHTIKLNNQMMWVYALCLLAMLVPSLCRPYDPEDAELKSVLPSSGQFEAFYPREAHGVPNGSSRPAHGHGSFYKHRNPALVDVKNAAAYGFRFDGMRRFNFDDE